MSRPKLLPVVVVVLVLFAVTVGLFWWVRRQADDPDAQSTRQYSVMKDGQVDCIGQIGDIQHNYQGLSHRLVVPYSQHGREVVCVMVRHRMGPPFNVFDPIIVLLLRLGSPELALGDVIGVSRRTRYQAIIARVNPAATGPEFGPEVGPPEDEDKIEVLSLTHSYPAAGGQFQTRYAIPDDSGMEQFHLGGTEYPLAGGRVFLIDLSAHPVRVRQVNDDPAAFLPTNYPTKHDLRTVRHKLEARHPAVCEFWTR